MRTFNATKLFAIFSVLVVSWSTSPVNGQQTTEQFIPIGYSPGISKEYSFIGPITAVNLEESTIIVDDARGTRTIKVTPETRIWLDRSKIKKANVVGDYSDCQPGRLVEVMYNHDDETVAVWIKIETMTQ